ncbi:MAG: hypothetical protein J0H49_10605 [Acidobacteria bacterium]|nr:hypothetical protein [Acidobacteriota bacterium]
MNWLKRLIGSISAYFRTGRAAKDAQTALEYVGRALPYVKIAADLVVSLKPTQVDDLAWTAIKAKYPSLFDGRVKTQDEMKASALLIASDLLKAKYPELSTSVARAAVQLAYIDAKAAA